MSQLSHSVSPHGQYQLKVSHVVREVTHFCINESIDSLKLSFSVYGLYIKVQISQWTIGRRKMKFRLHLYKICCVVTTPKSYLQMSNI